MSVAERYIGCFLCIYLALTYIIVTSEYFFIWFYYIPPNHLIKCYANSSFANKLTNLDPRSVRVNNSIFFLETTCHRGNLKISVRQACAIESAARLNPDHDVFLLLPSPVKKVNDFEPQIQALFTYSNFRLRHINTNTFFEGTPLKSWWRKGVLRKSKWPRPHASDILRYVALWKYGGIYSDLDVIFLKSLGSLMNFVGVENENLVGSSIMSLSKEHPIANLCMENLLQDYNGDNYAYNGPELITRIMRKYCDTDNIMEMTQHSCQSFKVLPPSAFYPVPWEKWRSYFLESELKYVAKLTKDSFAIHAWNYLSRRTDAVVGSQQPYAVLAEMYCPKVYSTTNATF